MRLRVKLGHILKPSLSENLKNIFYLLKLFYTERYHTSCPFIPNDRFAELNISWLSENSDKNISHSFMYMLKFQYDSFNGQKPSSFEEYLNVLSPQAIYAEALKMCSYDIGFKFFDKWNKIYNALMKEYNPLSNYNMDEHEEYNTDKKTKTNTDIKSKVNTDLTEKTNVDLTEKTNTDVKVSTNVDTTEKTNTDVKVSTNVDTTEKTNTDVKVSQNVDTTEKTNTDVTTKHKIDQTNNDKEYVYGFNSNDKVPKSESDKTVTGLPDNNYDETKGVADNNYLNKTADAQDNYQQTVGDKDNNYVNKTADAQDNYQQTVGNKDSNYTNKTADAQDNYQQTVGNKDNNYTNKVGDAEHNYQQTVGDAEDNYQQTVGDAENNYIEEIGDAENNYRHLTKEGNIGIRSNQELLEQELEVRKNNFYGIMFQDINSVLLNNIYY